MTLPQGWNLSNKRKANTAGVGRGRVKKAKVQHSNDFDIASIEKIITKHYNASSDETTEDEVFNIDSFINNIPFFKCLSDIKHDSEAPSIPLVSRVYEEMYMRSCHSEFENKCIMDSQCECTMLDSQQPFVGVQFDIPGNMSGNNGMCVLCLRKTTQLLFYNIISKGQQVNCVIQKYGNICGTENEYHQNAMLICPPNGPIHNMPFPIVAHQRNRYSVSQVNGVMYIKQHNVYMEDFVQAPSD